MKARKKLIDEIKRLIGEQHEYFMTYAERAGRRGGTVKTAPDMGRRPSF